MLYHKAYNKYIWPHAACFVEDNMYLTTNIIAGLYRYDEVTQNTKYIDALFPEIMEYKYRTICAYGNNIYLFPYYGDRYEVIDTLTEKTVWSIVLDEGYMCTDVCDMNDNYYIFEYNESLKKNRIRIWNKNSYELSEWTELSDVVNRIESSAILTSYLKKMVNIDHLLVIGVGDSDKYIIADSITREIKQFALKDCSAGISTFNLCNDKVYIVTNDYTIMLLDVKTGRVLNRYNSIASERLFVMQSMNGKIFAVCHNKLELYYLNLNDSKGEYYLQPVLDDDCREQDTFVMEYPYLEMLIKGNSLFLLPIEADDMIQYIFSSESVKKVVHRIEINKEHMEAYIMQELIRDECLFENDCLGRELDLFIDYICDL